MKKLLALSLCMCFLASQAQQDDSAFIRKIANQILVSGKAYDDLRALTKQVGPRLSGSQAMVKAEQWGLKTLQALQPDKAWLQECMVPHWIRGGKDQAVARTKQGRTPTKNLDVIALGNSVGSGAAGVTADVMVVKDFAELDARKNEARGKIVFYNYPFNPTFVKTFLAYGDAVRYRGGGPSQAAKYGAKAVIVRSMSESTDNAPHTGATRYADSLPKIPALAIGLQDADWLNEAARQGPVTVTLKTYGQFLPDTIGHNVIAEIRGTEFPDQYITIGGHLDSWDPAEGAHDDGTGVVQTIEILRTFRALGYQPKHTIRFVLFANEENGLRGALKYAEEAKAKGEQHIFGLESDAGGFTPRGFSITASAVQLKKLESWKPLLSPYGTCEFGEGAGADVGPLYGPQTPVGELAPDSQRYFDIHHSRNDVFENVNKRELELGAVNMAALVYLVDKYGWQ